MSNFNLSSNLNELTHAEMFFSPWEYPINSWEDANKIPNDIKNYLPNKRLLVWKGVNSVEFALHSTLHRSIQRCNLPMTEKQTQKTENQLLAMLRTNVGYSKMNSLEIISSIQHYGGDSRLIDVSKDFYVALWFACEIYTKKIYPFSDARLYAFDISNRWLNFTQYQNLFELPWNKFPHVLNKHWQLDQPYFWDFQDGNERMNAQKAGFLLGGLPKIGKGRNSRYRKNPNYRNIRERWNVQEVHRATSVNLYLHTYGRKVRKNSYPSFVFRINHEARTEILEKLDLLHGINHQTLFPDSAGIGKFATLDNLKIFMNNLKLGNHL